MQFLKHGSWFTKGLMFLFGNPVMSLLFFIILGVIGGVFTSPYAQNSRVTVMILGGMWGAFIGTIYIVREKSLNRWVRRTVGAVSGMLAGGVSGIILGYSIMSSVLLAITFATLGYFGHYWAKHLTFP